MRLIVLGAAAGGGFPQWNSACPVGRRAWQRDPAARWRTQCSVALSADGERWTLLNASPDLRQQILATPELHPRRGPRHSPIAAVVLTNGDVDHVAGLLSLRESQRFVLYATGSILEVLKRNPIFEVLNPEFVPRDRLVLEEPVELEGGITVVPFAVPGKVPLYLEGAALEIGVETEDVIGLQLGSAQSEKAFFIPGCARLTPALAERVRGAALIMFDGTLWADDEMIRSGAGVKTGARMGHMSLSGPDGTLAAFAPLGVRRKILIHINNTNPVLLDDSSERAAVTAAGWEVAYDGMEIAL
jgi:pyrroloquinoline quinone biosynthesis protein B